MVDLLGGNMTLFVHKGEKRLQVRRGIELIIESSQKAGLQVIQLV